MFVNKVYWLKVPTVGLGQMHLRWLTVTGTPPFNCFGNTGASCFTLAFLGSFTTPGCTAKLLPGVWDTWVSIDTLGTGGTAILTAGAGPC